MAMSALTLGPALAAAAGSTDPVGIAAWASIAQAIIDHIKNHAEVLPTPVGLVAPPGGGPVTGSGTIR